jgi:hypothetical protein
MFPVYSIDNLYAEQFRQSLKEQWALMWRERFDDRFRAEGIAVHDYPFLFVDRGFVLCASKEAKAPDFSEILGFWASKGRLRVVDPAVGGWGKFIRTHIRKVEYQRARVSGGHGSKSPEKRRQLKKGGRGWLHTE